jgi:hypothetical protein
MNASSSALSRAAKNAAAPVPHIPRHSKRPIRLTAAAAGVRPRKNASISPKSDGGSSPDKASSAAL